LGREDLPPVKGLGAIAKFLTPAESGKLRRDTAEALVSIFKQLPPDADFRAAALAGIAKRGWYTKSANAIIEVFGDDAPRFTALLAAISPTNPVEQNLQFALRVWREWVKGGRKTSEKAILRAMKNGLGENMLEMQAWIPN